VSAFQKQLELSTPNLIHIDLEIKRSKVKVARLLNALPVYRSMTCLGFYYTCEPGESFNCRNSSLDWMCVDIESAAYRSAVQSQMTSCADHATYAMSLHQTLLETAAAAQTAAAAAANAMILCDVGKDGRRTSSSDETSTQIAWSEPAG